MSRGAFTIPAITVELTGYAGALDLVARFGPRVIEGTRRGLLRGMKLAESEAVRILRGGPGNTPGPGPGSGRAAGTGVLARSVIGYVRTGADGLPIGAIGVRKGLADKYARIQELGTVGAGGILPDIQPVRARALTIPLAAARDARGVPLYSGPRDPKIAGQLFVINRKGKPGLLARNLTSRRSTRLDANGKPIQGQNLGRERVEPLFVFAARSSVKPRRYLRGAVERTAPAILRAINDGIASAMSKGAN